ncbi:phage head morphogenesis protein [Pseudoalteromonas fuliginea]|uniref:Phage head morphogenesis protein n=1 Tax=Pseudoalteromonas fuliginea TaxID=1872678 RepID=A0AB73BM00_9GAMM|nr:phage minor head protein [Pseudoalteromonas fuliginea]KAA1165473.1 phage head morphogenesis protein [Pseudoalteromonas fuliginea]
MPSVSLTSAFDKPPADAVAYFKSKGYAVSDEWHDMLTSAHSKAFTVARAQNMDVLSAIRGELDAALTQGLTAKQFNERLTPQLQKLGWWGKAKNAMGDDIQLGSPYRLNTIYRTNMQTAYMAGRYRRMLSRAKTHPYWQYVAIDDGQTRPEHKLLNGRVFRFDDPIWQTIYPPNGWGCRCRVRALTEAQVKARGITTEDGSNYVQPFDAEIISRETGDIKTVPHARVKLPPDEVMTPDVGWAYSPGQSAFGTDTAIAQKLGKVPDPQLRAETIQALNNSPAREAAFELWTKESLARVERYQLAKQANNAAGLKANGPRPQHKTVVSFLADDINQQLIDKGIEAGRVITLSERALAHAHSTRHKVKGQALELNEYTQLSTWLNNPQTKVYWDTTNNNLMYVYPSQLSGGEQVIKVIVDFAKVGSVLDPLINVFKVTQTDINAGIAAGYLKGWR